MNYIKRGLIVLCCAFMAMGSSLSPVLAEQTETPEVAEQTTETDQTDDLENTEEETVEDESSVEQIEDEQPVEEEQTEESDTEDKTDEEDETDEEETNEVVEADTSLINYFVVEYPFLSAPATQNFVFSYGDGTLDYDSMYITLQREGEYEPEKIEVSNQSGSLYEFSRSFSELDTGIYTIPTLTYTKDHTDYVITFSNLEMDIRFGVNEEYDGYDQLVDLEDIESSNESTTDVSEEDIEENVASINSENVNQIENIISDTIEDVDTTNTVSSTGYSITYMNDKAKAALTLNKSSGVLQTASTTKITIGLDPGHGGSDSGAVGVNGVLEKDLNLKIALYCKQELEQYTDCKVVMSRTTDVSIPDLYDRCKSLVDQGADVVISIHLNSTGTGSANGVEVYYPNTSYNKSLHTEGYNLSNQIIEQLASLGIMNRGIKMRTIGKEYDDWEYYAYPDDSVADYYGIIRHSKNLGVTGIIIEHCFIDNTSDYNNYLSSDAKLQQLGIADATGIAKAYSLSKYPVLNSATNVAAGVKVTWKKCAGANLYKIFRKDDSSDWKELDSTTSLYYTDKTAEDGTTYTYTVAARYGTSWASFDPDGISCTYVVTPVLTSANNIGDHITVKWKKGDNIDSYILYRKENGGTWTVLQELTTNSYKDYDISYGTTYTYTVRAIRGENRSGYVSDGITCIYLEQPEISLLENKKSGIKITWNAVTSATGYTIYRKEDSGWVPIGTSTTTSFTDQTAEVNGREYTYTVQATAGDSVSTKNDTGASLIRLTDTVLKSAQNKPAGIQLEWSVNECATSYNIYRKTDSTDWVCIDTTTETSYLDIDVDATIKYTYSIQASCEDANSIYGKSSLTITRVTQPYISSLTNNKNSIAINWSKVQGATSYTVYRLENGEWKKVTSVTANTASDTDVESGTTYTYTVKAFNGSDESSYNSKGTSIVRLAMPSLSSVTNSNKGIVLKWDAITGAEKYRVYRKANDDTKWTILAEPSDITYTDTDVENGSTYTYTIRAYCSGFLSSYNKTGSTIVRSTPPELTDIQNDSSGITVSWNAVEGATKYAIYRKEEGGQWSKYLTKSCKTTSYTDTTAVSGTTYVYTVKAYVGVWSIYDNNGISMKRLEEPVISSIQNTSAGVQIKWNSISGANSYTIYRKSSEGTSYTEYDTSTKASYIDTSVSNGTTYSYTIQAVNTTYTSSYNDGKSLEYIETPALNSCAAVSNGIEVSWSAVEGATGYRLYRKTSTGWSVLYEGENTSYIDTDTGSQSSYTYTVRALKDKNQSGYIKEGITYSLLITPEMTSVLNKKTYMSVNWMAVEGATGYTIYRKSGTDSFKAVGTSTTTTYKDTDTVNGTIYTYTVQATNNSSQSEYDSKGLSYMRVETPVMISCENETNGMRVKWNAVDGVDYYCLYRKSGSHWQVVGNTDQTNGIDMAASSNGTTYTYTVRAIKGSYRSYYDTTGVAAVRVTSSGYSIMGSSNCTVAQMVAYYKANNSTYDTFSSYGTTYDGCFAQGGASTIEQFCQIFYEEATAEGVRAEVAFCQAMLETGFLQFGGDVKPNQYNFAGLGATGGVPGNSFSSVRIGIRAQIQHLKAYASTEALNNDCVDVRFTYVTRGCAPTVQELATKWAADSSYGTKIISMISALQSL